MIEPSEQSRTVRRDQDGRVVTSGGSPGVAPGPELEGETAPRRPARGRRPPGPRREPESQTQTQTQKREMPPRVTPGGHRFVLLVRETNEDR